tara:strand:- start:470 stop:2797 length:2328 start_codon:yes stop_codon:yes gene_type:complete
MAQLPTAQSQRAPTSIPTRTITADTGFAKGLQQFADEAQGFIDVEVSENDDIETQDLGNKLAAHDLSYRNSMNELKGSNYGAAARQKLETDYTSGITKIQEGATNARVSQRFSQHASTSQNNFNAASSSHALTQGEVVKASVAATTINIAAQASIGAVRDGNFLSAIRSSADVFIATEAEVLRTTGDKNTAIRKAKDAVHKLHKSNIADFIAQDSSEATAKARLYIRHLDIYNGADAETLADLTELTRDASIIEESQAAVTGFLAEATKQKETTNDNRTIYAIAEDLMMKAGVKGKALDANRVRIANAEVRAGRGRGEEARAWFLEQVDGKPKRSPDTVADEAARNPKYTSEQVKLIRVLADDRNSEGKMTSDEIKIEAQILTQKYMEGAKRDPRKAKEQLRKDINNSAKGSSLRLLEDSIIKRIDGDTKELASYSSVDASAQVDLLISANTDAATGKISYSKAIADAKDAVKRMNNVADSAKMESLIKVGLHKHRETADIFKKVAAGEAYTEAWNLMNPKTGIGKTLSQLPKALTDKMSTVQKNSLNKIRPKMGNLHQELLRAKSDYLNDKSDAFLRIKLKQYEGQLTATRLKEWQDIQASMLDGGEKEKQFEARVNRSSSRAQRLINSITSKMVVAEKSKSKKALLNEDVANIKYDMEQYVRDWYNAPANKGNEMPSKLYNAKIIDLLRPGHDNTSFFGFDSSDKINSRVRAIRDAKKKGEDVDFTSDLADDVAKASGIPINEVKEIIENLVKRGVATNFLAQVQHLHAQSQR